ncbi:hypothetical protein AAE478_002518 [Parahypoxylon ruwenzoriense]
MAHIIRVEVIVKREREREPKREVIDLTKLPSSLEIVRLPPSRLLPPATTRDGEGEEEDDHQGGHAIEAAPAAPLRALIEAAPSRTATPGPGSSAAADAEASGSNSAPTQQEQRPATPRRRADGAAVANTPSSRKRRQESPEIDIVIRQEYIPRAATPSPLIKEEDDSDSDSDNNDDDDDEVVEISPFKRLRSSLDLSSVPVIPLSFQRSSSPSPSTSRSHQPAPITASAGAGAAAIPRSAPGPMHHASFPERPALQCPNRIPSHSTITTALSLSVRNPGRWYYRCQECFANRQPPSTSTSTSTPSSSSSAVWSGASAFVCWADTRGVSADNPSCACGHPSRQDITGESTLRGNVLFYKCATDACSFRRYDWDDPVPRERLNEYCGTQV